jgi:hypothetical protein
MAPPRTQHGRQPPNVAKWRVRRVAASRRKRLIESHNPGAIATRRPDASLPAGRGRTERAQPRIQSHRPPSVGGALLLAIGLVAAILLTGGSSYQVRAPFSDASQLVPGDAVLIGPAQVGTVDSVSLTRAGQAAIVMSLHSAAAPLYRGTVARIEENGLAGIASHYVTVEPAGSRWTSSWRGLQLVEDRGRLPALPEQAARGHRHADLAPRGPPAQPGRVRELRSADAERLQRRQGVRVVVHRPDSADHVPEHTRARRRRTRARSPVQTGTGSSRRSPRSQLATTPGHAALGCPASGLGAARAMSS